jgi:hypothetical protein
LSWIVLSSPRTGPATSVVLSAATTPLRRASTYFDVEPPLSANET